MTTAHIPVGVEVERRATGGAQHWTIARLRPGARHLSAWTPLSEADGVTRFYAGTARLTLRATEARHYAALLATAAPSLTVVLARSGAEPGWALASVALAPSVEDAGVEDADKDAGADAFRALLPIPDALRTWIAEFAAHHARPEGKPAPPPEPRQSFLDRWSRLKKRDRRPDPSDGPAPLPPPAPVASPEARPDLPPLDSLRTRADYAAYLRAGAPVALRLAALRQAWASDPAIAGHKPLVDYDWNFNAPGYGRLLPADNAQKLVDRLFRHLREATTPEAEPTEIAAARPAEAEPDSGAPEAPAATGGEPDEPSPPPPFRRHGGASPA